MEAAIGVVLLFFPLRLGAVLMKPRFHYNVTLELFVQRDRNKYWDRTY